MYAKLKKGSQYKAYFSGIASTYDNKQTFMVAQDAHITFSDGSYIKSVLIDDSTDCSSLARKTSTKTGRRVYSYESSSGKLLWTITITGTFSYTGSSSKCTKSEISTTCPASNWKLS